MYLLIKEGCLYCRNVENLDQTVSGLKKFYVDKNYDVDIDGEKRPLDEQIREKGLPALIDGNNVYIGEKYIIEFVNTLNKV